MPLREYTTLGVGGPARYFVEATAEADVARAVAFAADRKLPLFVLGGGSNLLVADAGHPGVVLRMGIKGIEEIREAGAAAPPATEADGGSPSLGGPGQAGAAPRKPSPGRTLLRAGAGEDWDGFVSLCVGRNLAGVECLSGIPGTVGGTPVQNVGAYGQEVSSVIVGVRAYDRRARGIVELSKADCEFQYRASFFNNGPALDRYVIIAVMFSLTPGGPPALDYPDVKQAFAGRAASPSLAEVREAVRAIRRNKAMLLVPGDPDCRSAGSFFRNPVVTEDEYRRLDDLAGPELPRFAAGAGLVKVPAARLIEKAGFQRGYQRGGAAISSRHTLALVNRHKATAQDIFELAREIRNGVRLRFQVELKLEPALVGFDETF